MDFLFYLVQVNLYLILFYSFYRLVLFGETFHHLNRAYLVASALLSFGIPLWYSEYVQSWFITKEINAAFYTIYTPAMVLIRPADGVSFTWADFLKAVYTVGIGIFTIRLFITLVQLLVVLRNKNFEKFSAFSFFGYSFVDETLKRRETILAHEHVHIRQLHSADVMLFEVIAILNWFNPVVYVYKRDIKHIHEFIADEIASAKESSKVDYAMLLFTQEFGLQPHQLTNKFLTHSTLKRRIQMLNKPLSRKIMLLKYGLSVPLFVLMLVLSSAVIVENTVFETVESSISSITKNRVKFNAPIEIGISEVEDTLYAKNKIIKGRVVSAEDKRPLLGVSITVLDKQMGTTTNSKGDYEISASAEDKLRFSIMGFQSIIVPVRDKTVVDTELYPNKVKTISLSEVVVEGYERRDRVEDTALDIVDENPEFPGGVKELFRFISQNLKYPEEAQKNNVSGKVFARFIVKNDGSIVNVRILKGVGFGCDEETVRVISIMPKWKPGKLNGEPVNVMFTVPVNFTMEEKRLLALRIPSRESEFKIRMRGINGDEQIFILDGKEIKRESFEKIEARDVESIYVLKDNEAVKNYGERARAGVIVVNTKPNTDNRK